MKHRPFETVSKARPKEGWKNAPEDGDHMLFARADSVARLCAFNPKSVYDWAVTNGNDLKDILTRLGTGGVMNNPLFPALFDSIVLGIPFNPPKP